MILGALADAGAPLGKIGRKLRALGLPKLSLNTDKVKRGAFVGSLLKISGGHVHTHGMLRALMARKSARGIPTGVLATGKRIISRILHAEAKVHGKTMKHVHLHEIEDVDTVVDVYGTLLALDALGINRVLVSALSLGGGEIKAAHGRMPVPAPGTAELVRGQKVAFGPKRGELLTPTAAAIFAELAEPALEPVMTVEKVGYGAGMRDIAGLPNLLRVFTGVAETANAGETVMRVEAEVDDMNPQLVEAWMARVYKEGALEAWTYPVFMKRSRTGLALVALASREKAHAVARGFLEETTSLGVRVEKVERLTLSRRETRIQTRFGPLRAKLAGAGPSFHFIPEYRDALALATKKRVPVRVVLDEIRRKAPKTRI
jgi:uncharacterized protein (TIGR00299 family) protein